MIEKLKQMSVAELIKKVLNYRKIIDKLEKKLHKVNRDKLLKSKSLQRQKEAKEQGLSKDSFKIHCGFIYALRLENGMYYIGHTYDINRRMYEHFTGKGAMITKLHKPVEIIEFIEESIEKENFYTFMYMKEYGINNVRGGSYCHIERYSRKELQQIQLEINKTA